MKIPVSQPTITNKDKEALHRAVDKGWFTEGTQCAKFSKSLGDFTDQKFVQLVNSGSSANLVALTAACEAWEAAR